MQTDIRAAAAAVKSHLLNGQIENLTNGRTVEDKPLDKAKVAKFWERMTGLFGYRWASQYGDVPSGEWVTLINALSPESIDAGIRNVVATSEGWPPTPIEFNHLCTGVSLKAMGLPELDEAFHRALSGMYRNAVIEAAAKATDVYDLQRGTTGDLALKKRFELNYFEMARRWAKGESLSKPVTKAIEHKQEAASYGSCDDLIQKELERQGQTKLSGYEAFKQLRRGKV